MNSAEKCSLPVFFIKENYILLVPYHEDTFYHVADEISDHVHHVEDMPIQSNIERSIKGKQYSIYLMHQKLILKNREKAHFQLI